MRRLVYVFLVLSLLNQLAIAGDESKVPHILPDADGYFLQRQWQKFIQSHRIIFDNAHIQQAISSGERNLFWLKQINSQRTPDKQLKLTKPGQANTYPMTNPSIYGPKRISAHYLSLRESLPQQFADVVFGSGDLPHEALLADDEFVMHARSVDKLYQTAVRWQMLSQYKSSLEARRRLDVRGYYFLSLEPDLENKLNGFTNLSLAEQERLAEYLQGICINTRGPGASCEDALQESIKKGRVFKFYESYLPYAKQTYDNFFILRQKRSDVVWNQANPAEAIVPFRDPRDTKIANWLTDNIQDEWKWLGWQLRLDFKPRAPLHVVFIPSETPNVDRLGGNVITMDANVSIDEWEVRWTIRHEFGHALGFPDCYVEFYDRKTDEMTNYQLDIDNLMCSRAGKFMQTHFDEMKRSYFKK